MRACARPSSSTGPAPSSITARSRRWACSSRPSPSSAWRSPSTRRAGPMGMAKRPHIAALMALPRIAEAWRSSHGRAPTEADIDAVYDVFVPKNIAVAAPLCRRSFRAPPSVVDELRATRPEDRLDHRLHPRDHGRDHAGRGAPGFAPDCLVCTGDTPDGRPTPFMLYKALPRPGGLAGLGLHQGRRHRGRHRRGPQRRLLDRRRRGHRQRLRPVACRHAGARARRSSHARRRGRDDAARNARARTT